MSHNLYKNTMMYTGEKPWHSLGVKLDNPATAKEAIKVSGLDYKVIQQPVMFEGKPFEQKMFNVNEETKEALAIVGGRYKIVQNEDAFEFLDSVVGSKDAMYHTAGALGKGESIWLLAKLPKNILISKDDVVEKYLCLTNSHDGTSALRVFFTPIRVVCQNTLTLALKDRCSMVSIRHTENCKEKITKAREVLGLAIDFYDEVELDFNALSKTKVTTPQRKDFYEKLLRISDKEDSEVSARKKNMMEAMTVLGENGKGNKPFRGTAWSLYNSVTEYIDHSMSVKGLKEDPTRKAQSIVFGSGARKKARAFNLAMALVK
jgi:phage/plasmid-like protein (TIGR03299 family)